MNTEICYPLSSPQQAVWLDQLLAPDLPCYNIGTLVRFDGLPDMALFEQALRHAVASNDALRIVLEKAGEQCLQRFDGSIDAVLQRLDLSGRADADAQALAHLRQVFDTPFALYGQRLWCMHWVQTAADRAYWLVCFHHLAVDGLSVALFGQCVADAYNRLRRGEAPQASAQPDAYRDFVLRDGEYFASPRFARDGEFWRQRFAHLPPPLFEGAAAERGRGDRRYSQLVWPLARAAYVRLNEVAVASGASSTHFLLAVLAIYFSRLSGRDDEIVIGMPVHNRTGAVQRRTVGMFSAAMPVGIRVDAEQSFAATLQNIAAELKRCYRHQRFPLAEIHRQLLRGRSERRGLFDLSLSMEGFPGDLGLDGDLRTAVLPLHNGYERQPLALYVRDYEQDQPVRIEFNFDPAVLPEADMHAHLRRLSQLTEAAIAAPQTAVGRLPLLDAEERNQVLHGFNQPRATFAAPLPIQALFEQQAAQQPQAIALSLDAQQLSYAELNARANQLAQHLRSLGVGPDVLVALHLQRGFDLVVAILATLKAGGAYVPLDPAYPPERLHYMLQDSAPAVLLTQASLADVLELPLESQRVVVDAASWDKSPWAGQPTHDLSAAATGLQPAHLAYIIYTSGSTGLPKGVMVEHRQVTRLFDATRHWFGFGKGDVWSLFHSFAFDFSVWELWGALLHGGRLVIVPQWISRSPQDFHELVCAQGVTVLNQTPSAFRQFIAAQAASAQTHALRQVIFGGEALDLSLLQPWYARERNRAAQLVNMYGITETTVHVTYRALQPADAGRGGASPIGERIPDLSLYLLDAQGQPVPVGMTGELHVGGAGVARGYLRRPELSAQRFVDDPFGGEPGARLYRSGDLARWLPDGSLEYLGRNDFQVKIRGFRIELGEIQAQLAQLPQVRDAIVMAREDQPGDMRLVAYLVMREPDAATDPAQWRTQLKQHLPDYMLPAAFVVLEQLPLTANGKLDRQALPAPQQQALALREYEPPQGKVETALAQAWSQVLGVQRIGRQDNFFELGGHSLLAVRLIEQLQQRGIGVDIRQLFAAPSLAALAAGMTGGATADEPAVPPNTIPADCAAIVPAMLPLLQLDEDEIARIAATVPGGMRGIQDIYPLSPLQEGILFHHLLEGQGDAYVLPALLRFDSEDRLQRFVQALNAVIARHDILRTAVLWQQLREPVQVVWRQAQFQPEWPVLIGQGSVGEPLLAHADPRRVRLDLQQAPLLRGFAAYDAAEQTWLLQLLHHHLTLDHTTTELLLQEVVLVLQQRSAELPAPVAFRDFVARARRRGGEAQHEAYFRRVLGDMDTPTAPFGLLQVQGDGSEVVQARAQLPANLAQRLRRQVRAQAVSAASLFHLAWAQVLARSSGRDDVVFGSVLLGRLYGGAGVERAMGMFINTLPLRTRLGECGVAEGLQQVHVALAELLQHEPASLTLAQRCSGVAANTPLFAALLNYRHSLPQNLGEQQIAEGMRYLGGRDLTNYPFCLYVDDLGDDFVLTAEIHHSLPAPRVVALVEQTIAALVDALESAPQTPLRLLDDLPAAQRAQVLHGFNATQTDFEAPLLVHQRVEQQAALHPQRCAVELDGEQLSYAQLNAQANRLARHLRERGVQPDSRVAICLERSLDLVVALLATLKAGAAYLPLDPAYPDERLAQMLRDGQPVVVLSQSSLLPRLTASDADVVCLDSADPTWLSASADNLSHEAIGLQPDHLAYVIYTSGSTGVPKGVAMPHRSLANLLAWQQRELPQPARTLQFAALGFDVAFQEIFGTLGSGGTLVLVHETLRQDLPALASWIARSAIERVFLPYIALSHLCELWSQQRQALPLLQDAIVAGEQLRITPAIRAAFAQNPQARLHNHYGPTESHVVTAETLPGTAVDWPDLPSIGRPIANSRIYLLDAHGQPVPQGAVGEIHIGGLQLARGYLGQPALTAERFLHDPFAAGDNATMYKTGDLGRWSEDGRIAYLGRNDFQVKIRGYRVELGEIEAQLAALDGVAEAAVIAREDSPGDKRLVAYLVAQDEAAAPSIDTLRSALVQRLPEHMLPAAYVRLERLPLTPNGKLDRKALPAPEGDAYGQRDYVEPQGEIEQALAQIWSSLLGIARIGRNDHFFELGGHSLLAIRLVSQLRQRGWSLDVRSLFAQPQLAELAAAISVGTDSETIVVPVNAIPAACTAITPAMLPLVELQQIHIDRIAAATAGGMGNIQDIYPLAPLQKGILFHSLLQSGRDTYQLPTVLGFDSRERLDEFLQRLQQLIARHDILRTAVHWQGLAEPVQVVWRDAAPAVDVIMLDAAQGDGAQQLQAYAADLRLDLQQAPLLRAQVAYDAAQQRWLLQLVYHHLIMDHTALELLLQEMALLQQGRDHALPAPVPYREFVALARLGVSKREHEAHFRRVLADVDAPTAPFGLVDIQGSGADIVQAQQALPEPLALRLREQVRRRGVSAASLFHLACAQVLARSSGRDDVVFGTVLFGRLQGAAAADRAVGLFINTLPLRLRLGACSVEQGLQQAGAELAALLRHEHAELALAQRCSGLAAGTPVFAALLNYRHGDAASAGREVLPGVQFLGVYDRTNYPFGLYVDDSGDGFTLTAQIHCSVPAQQVIEQVEQTIAALVDALESAPQTPLRLLDDLPAAQRTQVLHGFNAMQTDFGAPLLVHQRVEQQAALHPQRCAVELDGEVLSYAQLNAQANRLARHLRERGVQPDSRVAICLERSLDLVVALLATLKAGAAYLPLDPAYPDERLAQMLRDGQPVVVLSQSSLLPRLAASDADVICLDAADPAWASASAENLSPEAIGLQPDHLAYVIYTSGSTGVPKGVAMPHRSLANLLAWQQRELPQPARTLQFAALGFDVAFQEIFGTLGSGGTLVLLHETLRQDLPALAGWIAQASIERVFLPYIALSHLCELWAQQRQALPLLQDAIVAGEQLRITPAIRAAFAQNPQARLHNHYGPTESHVVTAETLPGIAADWPDLPSIGRPIANSRIYLLDTHGLPVPQGAVGEIHIGGLQLARGYLGQPALTAERFLHDPFAAGDNAAMYKTGDLGRWSEDGRIIYLGRNDFQVKIRGYRVELGEIEAQLAVIDGVAEAVVIAREDSPGDKRLVAYVVAQDEASAPAIDTLRSELAQRLPEHMLPAAYVRLARLPLTPNGKLDRKALPAPEGDAYGQRDYVEPQGEIEQALAQIWSSLLGIERIGRNDHFFELGGHSLLAIRLVSQLREHWQIELPLAQLFAHPRLSAQAEAVAGAERSTLQRIPVAGRNGRLPLSFAQQRLWFIARMDAQASVAYHVPAALRLRGKLDKSALQGAFDRIVARHESLRTRFVLEQGEPCQVIDAAVALPLRERAVAGLGDTELVALCTQSAAQPFDLAQGPLLRAELLQLADDDHVLLLVMHHIVSDGWSLSVLMRECAALYASLRAGRADPLPPLAVQYADYSVWQRREAQAPRLRQLLRECAEPLRGAPALVNLPTDRPRPALQDYRGASIAVAFDAPAQQALETLCRRHGTTPYMTVLAAWAALVARLGGQDQVVIGSPHAGRRQLELEPLIGFFINTQVIVVDIAASANAAQLLQQVRHSALRAQELQDVPFEQLVEAVNPARSLAHHPLFQLMLTWHNTPHVQLQLDGLQLERVDSLPPSAQFDLALDLQHVDGRIAGKLNYASALFGAASVQRHWQQLQAMLRGMADDDTRPLAQIGLLDRAEREYVLQGLNATRHEYAPDLPVHVLIEQQAAAHPDAVALVSGQESIGYAELNRRANRLAHYLREGGVGPEQRVALCLERGFDAIVAVLAVLKAGAAYVPLAPAYPSQRLAWLLDDCAPAVVLTQASLRARLAPGGAYAVLLLDEQAALWAQASDENHDPAQVGLAAHNLAYVIYTSGSTGQPKGVLVEHRQLGHQLAALQLLYAIQPQDRVLQFSNLSFDVAAEEIFGALSQGAALVLRSDDWLAEPQRFCRLAAEHALTVANLPTLFWQQLAFDTEARIPASLRQIVIGGDAVGAAALQAWWQRPGHRPALNNAYGPTETTINASVAVCAPGDVPGSIGRPVANTRIYLLDALGEPVPLGAIGEIHIAGAGVARGYLNRPELSAERFVADPFCAVENERMYKTGDLGRWHGDGSLEFLGRNDFQVKIRGFRIELGEIEAQLTRLHGVGEAIVVARDTGDGDKQLVAYLVAGAGEAVPDPSTLRTQLAQKLPDYMLPAAYVLLPQLPLLGNGKLDRHALPAPGSDALAQRGYMPPQGRVETLLAQIWADLLGLEQVGRHDNFFELGGHSLLAVRMISQLRQSLDIELPLATLFAHPQLADLAQQAATAAQNSLSAIGRADRDARLPLSFAQQRLWYVTQIDALAGPAYHIPGALRLRGALDRGALQAAVQRIVERHEVLRTRFVAGDGQPCQVIDAPQGLVLDVLDARGLAPDAVAAICRDEAAAPFDLVRGPLLRCRLLQLGDDDHLLLLTLHHIIADGWSLSVLAREFSALYTAFRRGEADPLPPLSIQYADYAVWQRQWLQGPLLQQQVEYWKTQLAAAPELLALPTDRPRPAQQDYRGASIAVALDAGLSNALRALARRHGVTLYMTVLAAWAGVLARLSGQPQVVIGSSVAGRNRAELEPLIGFFVNAQALCFELDEGVNLADLLAQARRLALAAQQHGEVPFEQVVEALNPARCMAYNPVYQVRLAWQNTPAVKLQLEGLALESVGSVAAGAQFDLSLDLEETGEIIAGQFNYATALFDAATVQHHWDYLQAMLRALVADDSQAVAQVDLLDTEQRELLLHGFNAQRRDWPEDTLIHTLFEQQAAQQPDVLAIACAGETLSYAELNRRANRLAHALRALGIRPDDRVAFCLERSVDLAVALIATLKAGAAFVPLDPIHPDERLAQMLHDCAPRAVLTQAALLPRLQAPAQAAVLLLDAPRWAEQSDSNPLPSAIGLNATHLAYVIYTSGSTGVPKGVAVEHRNVLTFLRGLEECIHGQAPDCRRIAWNSSVGFDMAAKAWGQLAFGRSVHLLTEATRLDANALLDYIEQHAIEAMECTPSHLRLLQSAGFPQQRGYSLRKLLLGGEAIDAASWSRLADIDTCHFYNMYGPTECSVDAACGRIDGGLPGIGTVMPNARIYLLDAQLQPVPLGVAGEIHIGGRGVARGYLDRTELTAQRFLPDPFDADAAARMYKTGDLGRWRADGSIEYLGRNDFQVKVRGFRIELGEIEARLLRLPGLREAVVLAREDLAHDQRLVAYVVADAAHTPDPAALRAQLAQQLPDYMLPSAFVALPRLPLNANGKLDRKALPAPQGQGLAQQRFEEPVGEIERLLATAWADLLGVERVGRHDNFFELGGHSALAIQLIHRLGEKQLQVEVQMVFNAPTLADLASATVQLEEVEL